MEGGSLGGRHGRNKERERKGENVGKARLGCYLVIRGSLPLVVVVVVLMVVVVLGLQRGKVTVTT